MGEITGDVPEPHIKEGRMAGRPLKGESIAESGPRCGEAEEAKRRPASMFGGGANGSRAAPSSARRPGSRTPIFIFPRGCRPAGSRARPSGPLFR